MELILKFFIYSVLGCMMEVMWGLMIRKKVKSRRMLLKIPMCPVYGFGGILMSVLLNGFRDELLLVYSCGALLASAVELIYFLFFRLKYGIAVWDYKSKKANLFGGVCGVYTLLWGVAAVAFMKFVDPIVSGILESCSDYAKLLSAVVLSLAVVRDIADTSAVLSAFGRGESEALPDCFWYMKRDVL